MLPTLVLQMSMKIISSRPQLLKLLKGVFNKVKFWLGKECKLWQEISLFNMNNGQVERFGDGSKQVV